MVTCTPFPTGDLLTLISMWPQRIWAFISPASKQSVSTIKCNLDFLPVHSVLQFPETEIDLHIYYFCITTCFEAQERENVRIEGNNNKNKNKKRNKKTNKKTECRYFGVLCCVYIHFRFRAAPFWWNGEARTSVCLLAEINRGLHLDSYVSAFLW